jgi:hypothetical protein
MRALARAGPTCGCRSGWLRIRAARRRTWARPPSDTATTAAGGNGERAYTRATALVRKGLPGPGGPTNAGPRDDRRGQDQESPGRVH